jgi:hypothetical protein
MPAQGEVTVCREAAVGALRGVDGAMRGDATTNRGKRGNMTTRQRVERQQCIERLWCNEKPCDNQLGNWEVTAWQEVVAH